METRDIQDILPLVEGPSRYLGGEVNAIRKDPADVRLHMALAFPDLYEIGTSHFGLQILYDVINRRDDLLAERVFAPDPDMEARLRESGLPLTTLESRTPLAKVDIIGVSLLYELCYTNILTILDVAGIPFRAADRDERHPLLVAGGPCTCNPEPVADFFDAMVAGDGEEVLPAMADEWLAWREAGEDRDALLRRWSQLRGVYIPSFYEAEYGEDGLQRLRPRVPGAGTVQRAVIPNLDDAAFPDAPVIPYGKPVHDRLRLEVARGCTRGCRFCQAGMIYRPVRERSPETLLAQAERALAATGYEDLSLLSLSTGDYANIAWLMSELMGRCAADHVAVSLPSLRAGTLTPELMNLIKRVRKTGFTIAPEAGSQRLRDVINKNITEDDIVATVTDAFAAGWQTIKLYFMIGLPTETQDDLDAIVTLTDRLRDLRGPKGKRAKIHVSVGTFIPKPHTPFQWCPQLSLAESRARIEEMKSRLSKPGVQFKWQSPKVSFLEGVFSRGDRRLAPLLETAWRLGCRLDGWSDRFRFDLWEQAFDATGIDPAFFIARTRDADEPMPWDVIDMGVNRDFLRAEWENALAAAATPDCRDGNCARCGVCDFKTLQPVVHERRPAAALPPVIRTGEGNEATLELRFAKEGPARFLGHLEMVGVFIRAIRRAGIPVAYSGGFHPMPKISFRDPLPIGMESLDERAYLAVTGVIQPDKVVEALDRELPEGLRVTGGGPAPPKKGRKPPEEARYTVRIGSGVFAPERLQSFRDAGAMTLERTNKKGKTRRIDLKSAVIAIEPAGDREIHLTLANRPGETVRPAEALAEIFGLDEAAIRTARVTKH